MGDTLQEFTASDTGTDTAALDAAEDVSIEPVAGQTSDKAAENAVAAKMNEINKRVASREEKDELEQEGLEGPDNPDGDAPVEKKAEAEGDDKEEDGGDEEDDAAVAAKKDAPADDGFDKNLKHIAKTLGGWKDEDIDAFVAESPTLAKLTFSRIADSYNALSLQYARGARPVANQQQQVQQPAPQTATKPPVSSLDQLVNDPARLAQLKEVAGDLLTKAFIEPILAERREMQADREFIAGLKKESAAREADDVRKSINTTFEGLKGFEEFYGKAGETTQTQHDNRFKVGNLADQIRAGAEVQGVAMTIPEAIERAHLIVTAGQQRAAVREEIVKEVVKRSKQIVSRPTARRSSAPTTVKGDDKALAAVEDWMSQHDA